MANPFRGVTDRSTYFITSNCHEKKNLLQSDRRARLLVEMLLHYRTEGNYLLHEFVVMPDHFHLLLTPAEVTLERSMQFIKGGYSFRYKKELKFMGEIWQASFHDRRMRDAREYETYKIYIHTNPVKKGLCEKPEDWEFTSGGWPTHSMLQVFHFASHPENKGCPILAQQGWELQKYALRILNRTRTALHSAN